MSQRFVDLGKLGKEIDSVLENVSSNGDCCFLTGKHGNPKAVILDIQYYHSLMDIIEESEKPDNEDKEYSSIWKFISEIGHTASE